MVYGLSSATGRQCGQHTRTPRAPQGAGAVALVLVLLTGVFLVQELSLGLEWTLRASALAMSLVEIAVAASARCLLAKSPQLHHLGPASPLHWSPSLVIGIAAGVLLALLGSLLSGIGMWTGGPRCTGFTWLYFVCVAPICEELAFRGSLLRLCASELGPLCGIGLLCSVFVVVHLHSNSMHMLPTYCAYTVGLTTVRVLTGRLGASIVCHCTILLCWIRYG